jgi:acetyl esterase/lipase
MDRVVFTLPNMDDVIRHRDLTYASDSPGLLMDVYVPPDGERDGHAPGVIFIHGGPVRPDRNMKETGQYRSWGALAAASGWVGITFNHRYLSPETLVQSADDVLTAIQYIRQQAPTYGLDPNRLCLWACSGGGPHIAFALRDQPEYLRCLVIYYAVLDLRPFEQFTQVLGEETVARYSASAHLQGRSLRLPIFVARAGLDHPDLNQTLDSFVMQALSANVPLEVMNHPHGHHGFDMFDDNERSRQIIARSLAFMREQV